MLNVTRRQQFLDLMTESGWDFLILYGHAWRKDFFRSLMNFNFFGPHAAAVLSASDVLSIVVSHPWDKELLASKIDAKVTFDPDFTRLTRSYPSKGTLSIAGMELMEARFVPDGAVSATASVERLRRFKTPEEI